MLGARGQQGLGATAAQLEEAEGSPMARTRGKGSSSGQGWEGIMETTASPGVGAGMGKRRCKVCCYPQEQQDPETTLLLQGK